MQSILLQLKVCAVVHIFKHNYADGQQDRS